MTDQERARALTKPRLVYVHCNVFWEIDEGSICPMDHDFAWYHIYRPPRGRKRRVWICGENGDEVMYLSRGAYLKHDEENCYADV